MSERWRSIASSALVHAILLAIPFLVAILWLKNLSMTLQVHQGLDEIEHYQAILIFARQFPFVDLHRPYPTSSGPLMYYCYGALTRLIGTTLPGLRLANMLISYLAVLSIYSMLRRTLKSPPIVSLSLTAVVGFSPFLFGQSFIILSDNFMYLWIVVALNSLMRFARRPVLWWLVGAAVCTAFALLTRQFAIWLVPTAGIAAWRYGTSRSQKWGGLAIVAASCIPLILVMIAWGGVVQPGSAGMTAVRGSRYWEFSSALAVVGLFVITVMPLCRLKSMALEATRSPLLGVVGVAALVGVALDFIPTMPLQFGYLSLIASAYPELLGTGIVYWILAPLGAMFLAWAIKTYRGDPTRHLASVALAFVVLVTLASNTYYQRYVDVPILLLIVVLASGTERIHWLDFIRWWLLAAAFVGWIFAFVSMGRPVRGVTEGHTGQWLFRRG